MTAYLLRTDKLTKRYGRQLALDQLDLSLQVGRVYGLVGSNGAGKTTFFKTIMGLARPTSGTLELLGQSGHGLARARRQVGLAIAPAFYPYLNARQNLLYAARSLGRAIAADGSHPDRTNRRAEIDNLIELVGLGGVKKHFQAYSMGMKQRLAIARALLGHPRLIILDEPMNGLDPRGVHELRDLIIRTNRTWQTSFIISSHMLAELNQVATDFIFLEQGRLIDFISSDNLQNGAESLEQHYLGLVGGSARTGPSQAAAQQPNPLKARACPPFNWQANADLGNPNPLYRTDPTALEPLADGSAQPEQAPAGPLPSYYGNQVQYV
ncbi:MAG: ATP-binding cassette domain-containing protein [Coriobacteriales bacterium]|nr:ATP-binding cassette domain-containing protein [Coriobacteriales bacterium]